MQRVAAVFNVFEIIEVNSHLGDFQIQYYNTRQDFLNHFSLWSETRKRGQSKLSLTETIPSPKKV